jgi:asparagine synthase (glutamine-hydrolysing)
VGAGSDEQFCGYGSYMAYLNLYRNYWTPFKTLLPRFAQQGVAWLARRAASMRASLEPYADVIDRAAKNRECFWSGATTYWDIMKAQLIHEGAIQSNGIPEELVRTGMLPLSYFRPDSFNVVSSFTEPFDRRNPGSDFLTRMIYNEFKLRLPELLLMRVDKITMSVSLEARVPFLAHKLVEFSMDIPMTAKTRDNTAKYLLKKAVEGIIPHQIIYRKKMGFGAPMSHWLKGQFGLEARSRILASPLLERGYFNSNYIDDLFVQHRSGERDTSLYLWTLFNLTSWYDYWIERSAACAA